MKNLPDGVTKGQVPYRDMNTTMLKYKTFFPDMTPEQIIELSFEYFQKIDLDQLKSDDPEKITIKIKTKSELILLYIIDLNKETFFAIPVRKD